MKTTRHKPSPCLACGKEVDAASSPFDHTPNPGDISVCLYCGHLMAFADDLTFRPLTDAEMVEIAGEPRLLRMQKARAKTMRDYKG